MQTLKRTILPQSPKAPVLDGPASSMATQLRGLDMNAQMKALQPKGGPMPVGKAPAPLEPLMLQPPETGPRAPTEAERITAAISGASDVFKSEKTEYEETYLERHDRHHRNKDLKHRLESDPSTKGEAKQLYRDNRERSPDAARRDRNKALKQKLGKDDLEYRAQREYSGGKDKTDKYQAKARAEQHDKANPGAAKTTPEPSKEEKKEKKAAAKAQKALKRGQDKAAMERLIERAKSDGDWQNAAETMRALGIDDEDLRKEWNARVKSEVSRDAYRKNKVHRGAKGHEADENKNVKKVTDGLDGATTAAGTGAVASSVIARGVGDTHVAGTRGLHDNGQTVTTGGTANQAAGINAAVSGVVNMVGSGVKVYDAVQARDSDDPAVREKAKTDIIDGTIKLGTSTNSTAAGILKAVQAFAADPAVAAAMQLQAVPIVGIIGAATTLIRAAATLAIAAKRVQNGGKLKDEAKSQGNSALAAAFKGAKNADMQLVASSTVECVASTTAIIGHGLTLGGVTGPAGAAVCGAAAGISALHTLGKTVYESVEARAAKKAQVKYASAVKGGEEKEVVRRGKQLITSNIQYALQIIITSARYGDPLALAYLEQFDLDTKDFSRMSDANARAAIYAAIDKDDDPETLLDQIKGAPGKVRGGYNSIRKELGIRAY